MLLGGLWHGAAWNFVLWGLYCGALLAIHRMLGPVLGRRAAPRSGLARHSWFLARVLFMFTLTCVGWLVFRAESLAQLGAMSSEILTSLHYNAQILGQNGLTTLMSCAAVLLFFEIVQFRRGDAWLLKLPLAPRCLFYLLLMLGFIVFGRYDGATFIYFQF
jgi:D-alanyl-lipoteichoic acid acyltransferase DltB (MBOAT superfamily)